MTLRDRVLKLVCDKLQWSPATPSAYVNGWVDAITEQVKAEILAYRAAIEKGLPEVERLCNERFAKLMINAGWFEQRDVAGFKTGQPRWVRLREAVHYTDLEFHQMAEVMSAATPLENYHRLKVLLEVKP